MIILKPFELLLSIVFNFSFSIFNNYGVSLISMSAIITLLTTPIYMLADKWQNTEKNIQKEMQSDIDKIKAVYSGQKQYYLIQTTHRLHNYKFFYPLRSMLGILFQIPFFFSAYNVLSHHTGYSGVSFGPITDLSKPDTLLFGSINLLPILMTIINLLSAFLYSKSFKIKDNLQTFILAIFFLVFLYNSPAALLIYWTMNNVFSLIKSAFKSRNTKITFADERDKNIYKSFFSVSITAMIYITTIYAVTLYFHKTRFFVVVFDFIFACCFMYRTIKERNMVLFVKKHCFAITVFVTTNLLYVFHKHISFYNKIVLIPLFFCICYLSFLCIFEDWFFKTRKEICLSKRQVCVLFSLTIFMYTTLLPFGMLSTNPDEVNCPLLIFFGTNISVCIACVLCFLFFAKRNSKTANVFVFYFSAILILLYIFNSLLFPLRGTTITGFSLTNEKIIENIAILHFIQDLGITFFLIFMCYYFIYKNQKLILYLLIFIFAVNVFSSIKSFVKNKTFLTATEKDEDFITQEIYERHSFSKEQTNVIYFVADMMNSLYIEKLRQDLPDFDETFDGFTWYKNTVSVSGWTGTSSPSMYLGGNYAPLEMNKRNISPNDYFVRTGPKLMKESFEKNGYDFSQIWVSAESDFTPYAYEYAKKHNIKLNNISKQWLLQINPFFSVAPFIMKSYIYDNGKWLNPNTSKIDFAFNHDNALKSLSYMELLPSLCSTTNEKPRLYYMRSELSHTPYGINSNMELIQNEYPDPEEKSFTSGTAAYYSAKKLFILLYKFIDWLKKEGIYDNSIIVICSDHGNNCYDNILCDFSDDVDEKLYLSRANALYMIKPVKSKGCFIVDEKTPKSNGDIIATIGDLLGMEHDFKYHTKINDDGTSERYYSFLTVFENFRDEKLPIPYASWKITGNVYEKNSWKRLE